ncbi:MAG: flagellar export protein FliJ [Lachnospiraceae bacterium]|nr:flagellar export protein FliJ [Lachnospiraceae bacterium]
MAKFIYRMQNILDIKYKLEEQAKQHYMEVRMRLNEAQDVLEQLKCRKEEYFAEYRHLVSERLDVLAIEQCKTAILVMDEYIEDQKMVIMQIEQELEEAARLMNEATKERKIHEKLKDNQFEVFLQELNQEEMKEIDQLVSYQYNKNADEEE